MNLPPEKQALLDGITARLVGIEGVRGVVLGGSYARGTQHAASDLDVGIYYSESAPFRIEEIRAVADEISVRGTPEVTDFYGWGRWVNGGAWIFTAAGKVDFIYRNLEQVQRAITQAEQGDIELDFFQQPAYGFISAIYLAETHVCLPLYDPDGLIAALKTRVAIYPALLKQKTLASTLWLAEFSLLHAEGYAAAGNIYAAVGTLTRVAFCLAQALFALNETYYMTDKTAPSEIAGFALAPREYVVRLNAVLAQPGEDSESLARSIAALRELWSEVVALTGGSYRPAFKV